MVAYFLGSIQFFFLSKSVQLNLLINLYRDAEMKQDENGIFVGPCHHLPLLSPRAESSNEAECFEEVTGIMGVESDNPYDIVGVNHKMPAANIKKRYWKLSLICKIQIRRELLRVKTYYALMQPLIESYLVLFIGLAMEGDDVLLAELEVKAPPKRDEWMTTLPPERKRGGMPTHTTNFSRTAKEGRGDTSAWTDTPSGHAQKAKTNYLEAYNVAAALASNDKDRKTSDIDAALIDQYNKAKRSKTLAQKHQEVSQKSRSKKKSKLMQKQEGGEWVGNHPWKPWVREKDLSAGRQDVSLDAEDMKQGLSIKFSSGSFQRCFL
ncbi:uncharacterized protein LOC110696734 [Chenopodium quinoa]|uniref:uncharacterized protein LOC110696734 n=1 Tax=Chenopodium quinoa TaxID=63459 RepID=UPI000B77AF04|nr:uncharacterized protein LOC110696734 [Chenopodium quinoa]